MNPIDCLFVYGTLKKGHYNFCVVEPLVTRVLEGWSIRGTLFDLGPYPGLSLEGGDAVGGELLESGRLDELLRVTDGIEGDEYERVAVRAVSKDGVWREAWTYRFRGETLRFRRIDAGVWPDQGQATVSPSGAVAI